LQSFDSDRVAVEAMAQALGIGAQLGRPFLCVLHPERHPSAALHRAESGDWLYHDFHAHKYGGREWLTLAQVRAIRAGRTSRLSGPEHATWKLILLAEAGVLPQRSVPAPHLPPDTPPSIQHVSERFLFLLGCRWNYDHGDPAPFDRRFAAALAEVSERVARRAIEQLIRLNAISVAGMDGRTRLWLPTACELPGSPPLEPVR
jgi:hypothetical protein